MQWSWILKQSVNPNNVSFPRVIFLEHSLKQVVQTYNVVLLYEKLIEFWFFWWCEQKKNISFDSFRNKGLKKILASDFVIHPTLITDFIVQWIWFQVTLNINMLHVGLADGLYCVSNMRGLKKYIWLCRAVSLYLRTEECRRFQGHDSMSNENKRKNLKQS